MQSEREDAIYPWRIWDLRELFFKSRERSEDWELGVFYYSFRTWRGGQEQFQTLHLKRRAALVRSDGERFSLKCVARATPSVLKASMSDPLQHFESQRLATGYRRWNDGSVTDLEFVWPFFFLFLFLGICCDGQLQIIAIQLVQQLVLISHSDGFS